VQPTPGRRPSPTWEQPGSPATWAGRHRSLVRIVHRAMVVAEHVRLERSISIGSPKAAQHPGQRRPRAPKRWLGPS
jgi:hypothetical protein